MQTDTLKGYILLTYLHHSLMAHYLFYGWIIPLVPVLLGLVTAAVISTNNITA
jgi:CHASE2 domain-containing sensor protein